MMKRSMTRRFGVLPVWACAAGLVVGLAPAAWAQSTPDLTASSGGALARDAAVPKNWRWTLGAGVGVAPDYEGGDDYEAAPIPLARAQKGHRFFDLFGLHATSNLIDHPNWQIGPSLNFRRGYNNVSNKRVDNLTNRGGSVELGMKGAYVVQLDQLVLPEPSLELALEFLHDVSGGHDGWLLTPSLSYAAPLSPRWNFRTGVESTYASGSYMSHYFSINSSDAANSGLQNFDADAGFKDVAWNLGLGFEITERWDLGLVGQYKRMLGDADDSPVVDDQGDSNQFFGGLTVSYSWGG